MDIADLRIETARLLLRPPQIGDFDRFAELQADGTEMGPDSALDPELAQALDGVLAQALFEQADAALYAAKKQGRNRAVLQPALLPGSDAAAVTCPD